MPQNSGFGVDIGAMRNVMSDIQEKTSELGHKAVEAIDSGRASAASTLDDAASTLRSKMDNLSGGDKVVDFAQQTAEALGSTAAYVRNNGPGQIMNDLGSFVKSHPGPSLIVAAVVGFLVGRSVRNN